MSEALKEAQEQLKEAEGAENRDEGLITVLQQKVTDLADAEEASKAADKATRSSREKPEGA